MKNKLVVVGLVGVVTAFAAAACSSDDTAVSPGPAGSGTGGGGNSSAGKSSGGAGSGGVTTAGTTGAGTTNGGTTGAGTSAGGNANLGGEAGAGAGQSPGGEAGMGGATDGGAGGAGGAGEEPVVLTPTTCGYTEVEADSSQDTGLTVQGTPKVICGKFDTGHFKAAGGLLDSDPYVINLGTDDGLMRLELPTFTGLTRIEVTIDSATVVITQPVTVFNLSSFGGSLILRLSGYSAADPGVAIPYQISVAADNVGARCAANAGAAAFTEAGDGAGNRGNDVYRFDDDVPSFTAAADTAEPTGITLAKAASIRVNGVSADLPRVGDNYDGDSYAFHTGPTTTQLTLRADWTGSHDANLFVLKAGTLERAGYSTTFTNTSPEYLTVRVKPNTDYVAYLGAFGGTSPFNYALTFCGESYAFNGP